MPADPALIVVIDSDPTRAEHLVWQLRDLGLVVRAVESTGALAGMTDLAACKLLIVDGSLPVDSLAVLDEEKQLISVPKLLIASDEAEINSHQAFVTDTLRRPFNPDILRARASGLLHLHRQAAELRVERDLEIAREIQSGFLPQELPQLPGWQLAARFAPAYEVAGDFYDVFPVSNGARLGFLVADVCDKGIGAALYMGLARSLLRAFAQQNYTVNWADVLGGKGPRGGRPGIAAVGVTALSNAVTLTNNYIATNHGQSNMFATLFFGILDPSSGALSYVNAGHNPPIILDPQRQVRARLTNSAMPIGMFPGVEFPVQQAQLAPGELLLAFTDGVTEAKNAADEQFTDERLTQLLQSAPETAFGVLDMVQADVDKHVGGAPQSDDITMLALLRAALA